MLEKEVQQNAVEVQLNNAFTESRSGWESIDIDPVTNIRKWGCALDTTPLIYIHIGKCGGGSAYSRLQPVKEGYGGNKPRFCHRIHPLYLTNVSDAYKVHQGCLKCDAVTPLGHAIGCREPKGFCSSKKKYIRLSTIRCRSCEGLRQVYFGHNYLGSELHWLPKDFLSEWWETFFEPKIQSSESKALIQNQFRGMENRTQSFCSVNDTKRFRPSTADDYDQLYSACLRPLQSSMDEISLLLYPSIESETKRLTIGNHGLGNLDWSPFYASMPVLRATVVREPFSWLVTKYFWHLQSRVQKELGENKNERTKPNKYTKPEKLRHISQTEYEDLRQQVVDRRAAERYAEEMEHGSKYKYNKRTYTRDVELKNKTKQEEKAIKKEKAAKQEKLKELGDKCLDLEFATTDLEKRDFSVSIEAGWIHRFSIQYLLYLCGEDCAARYMTGISSIRDLEKQAEGNLRHSITVVGLLEDMDTFYDMITDRFLFMNVHEAVQDDSMMHSLSSEEKNTCRNLFKDPEYQNKLLDRSEALSAIVRLYEIAKEVNRYQLAELSQCKRKPNYQHLQGGETDGK